MFEIKRKSLIQHCERSELRLHFECTKVDQKWSILTSFRKPEACSQSVLPDRSILIGLKLVEKFKWDILGYFQTMWYPYKSLGFTVKTLVVSNVHNKDCREREKDNVYRSWKSCDTSWWCGNFLKTSAFHLNSTQ